MSGPQLSWINQAVSVLDGPPVPAPTGGAPLDVIDLTLDLWSLISTGLPQPFHDWIGDALDSFRELLDEFTGDSGAIIAHAEHCEQTAQQVLGQVGPIATTSGRTPGWTGPAADGFARTMSATAVCVEETGQAIQEVGARHVRIGYGIAAVKQELLTAVSELAARLVNGALQTIARAGLALAGGVLTVAGGVVGGGLSGAWQGFTSGGPVGAVVGGLSGAINGGRDAAAEAAQRLRAAWDSFLAWASTEVASTLEVVTDFVESSVEPMVTEIGRIKNVGQRAERAASLLTSGTDPGHNAEAPEPGTSGHDAQGAEPDPELDGDLIDLNQAIGDPDALLPDGYSRATAEDLAALGLDPGMMRDDNGFIAEVFVDPDGNYVVAFAGTTAGEAPGTPSAGWRDPDIAEDVVGAVTMSPQTQQVLAISEAVSRSGNGDNVVWSGHSLGGRLATIAALDTGNAAVTYNSAGVSQATIDYIAAANGVDPATLTEQANDGQVRRYWTGNDPLTGAQERFEPSRDAAPDALGTPIELTPPTEDLPLDGHGQDVVEQQFEDAYGSNGI